MADRDEAKAGPRKDAAKKEGTRPGAADAKSDHIPLADAEEVAERRAGSARVVHEVIRLSGEEELRRPALALGFSGLAAGLAISTSVFAKAYLKAALPDRPWAHLIVSLGYTVGFVIVILGRLQLFTESTITAVLPLVTRPTLAKLGQTARLWGIVFAANMLGTFFVALMLHLGAISDPAGRDAVVAVSRELLTSDALTTLTLGIPAGFLIASVPWVLPNARGAEFWVVVLVTWTIGIGGYAHVVAGATEAWTLWLAGEASGWRVIGGFLLPAVVGNVIGGSGLFALLAHGQVKQELDRERETREASKTHRSFFSRQR